MAQLVIDIDDAIAVIARDALCRRWNYTGANNNAAKMVFLKTTEAANLKDQVIDQLAKEAGLQAVSDARTTNASLNIS